MFWFGKGKLRRTYDETLEAAQEVQRAEGGPFHLQPMDFGRRLAIEKDIEADPAAPKPNAVFDESGNFVIYPSLLGIKVLPAPHLANRQIHVLLLPCGPLPWDLQDANTAQSDSLNNGTAGRPSMAVELTTRQGTFSLGQLP